MGKLVDNIIAFKLLKMVTTPFDKTDAYKLGIIDEKGKVLRKQSTLSKQAEFDAYNYLTRFVFNLKRIINKFGGENRLKSLAAALFLVKEHKDNLDQHLLTEQTEEEFEQILEDQFLLIVEDEYLDTSIAQEFLNEEMVTTSAIPKTDSGETQPIVKKKKYKILKRDIKDQMGDKS